MLQLLGDELIGSARLAVLELVKNAYDADATEATVTLDLDAEPEPMIAISDNGEGMTLDLIRSIWLAPGDDHRQRQRLSGRRTLKHRRLPLGEKGLGRFAVHKLGNRITLVTRSADSGECVMDIDWEDLISKPYLDEAPVTITVRDPEIFTGEETGTRIEIRSLRETDWTRREIRSLYNQVMSICSRFQEPDDFQVVLNLPGRENWVVDLPDISAILDRAIWKFIFHIENGIFDWTYEFCQVPGLNLERRVVDKSGDRLKLPPDSDEKKHREKIIGDGDFASGIGPVTGEFYVYDRDQEIRRRLPNIRAMENYLDENGGIRVYRDGIRVYNYGELGDDWLGLDLRRVNVPTLRISRNIIIGAVHIYLEESDGLVEKTNREGFVENDACARFRRMILGALAALEEERQIDKNRIRKITKHPRDPLSTKIEKPIQELRLALEKSGMKQNFGKYVDNIEADYRNMQEILLSAGMSGLNLAVIFHEIERGVKALHKSIIDGVDKDNAARQAQDLVHLLDGVSVLLRRDSKKRHGMKKLMDRARQDSKLRVRYHGIDLVSQIEGVGGGIHSRFVFKLAVGALENLIDNAIYWLRVRWPDVPPVDDPTERMLYVGLSRDFDQGPAVVVADNGPGFQGDDPENLIRPFFTRKPEGMGLGLYYANLAMELNGGQLVFPEPGEVDLPDGLDGAVVALIFKED